MVLLISVGQNMCGSMYFHGCLHVYSFIYLVLCVCVCVSLGSHGAFPLEGGPVNSHPETNLRLQLSICGDHDRRPAQPAHHTATAGAGVCVCVCVCVCM